MNARYKVVTTHKTQTSALLVGVFGLGLLWAITYFDWFNHHSVTKGVLREVVSLLFASVAVTLIWELAGKRAFLHEVPSAVRISESYRQAGIQKTFLGFATVERVLKRTMATSRLTRQPFAARNRSYPHSCCNLPSGRWQG